MSDREVNGVRGVVRWRGSNKMILYHRTDVDAAKAILDSGFKDGRGTYMTRKMHSGVWLSNVPLDENEGAWGDVLLELTVSLRESELSQYEWIEEGKPYREFLIPAARLNPVADIRIIEIREM